MRFGVRHILGLRYEGEPVTAPLLLTEEEVVFLTPFAINPFKRDRNRKRQITEKNPMRVVDYLTDIKNNNAFIKNNNLARPWCPTIGQKNLICFNSGKKHAVIQIINEKSSNLNMEMSTKRKSKRFFLVVETH